MDYELVMAVDLPATGEIPAHSRFGPDAGGPQGDVAAVRSEHQDWMFTVQPGMLEFTTCFEWTFPGLYVLNHKGNLYWIDATHKTAQFIRSRFESFMSSQVGEGLVISYDFCDVCLINEAGLFWRADDLASDGLELLRVESEIAVFRGWKSSPDDLLEIEVDLRSGTVSSRPI
jgi:hypothetical protein